MALSLFRRRDTPLATQITMLSQRVESLQADLVEARSTYVTGVATTRSINAGLDVTTGKGHAFQVLYDAWKACPWISAPFEVIARRIVSGGWELTSQKKGQKSSATKPVEDLFYFVNPYDDLNQLVYQTVLSLLIFGKGYWEIVEAGGKPFELYYVNPISMSEKMDERGEIESYTQDMGDGTKLENIDPSTILRFVLTGPLGETISPIHKLLGSTVLHNHMKNWGTRFFENGGVYPVYAQMPEESDGVDAERFQTWWETNMTGAANARKMPAMYGGTELKSLTGQGTMEMDFLRSLEHIREEFLSVIGVPMQMLGIAQPGGLGDRVDSADKAFRNNTVNPNRNQICEKITYRIIDQGFGITGWSFSLPEANYRGDDLLIKEVITKVNAGIVSRQDAAKQLGDEDPGPGSEVPAISLTREVVPVPDLQSIHGSQFVQAQAAAINTGLPPHVEPDALAQASPNDPTTPGATHPVAVRQKQMAQNPPPGNGKTANAEALADLQRWQRVALKTARKGAVQPLFESHHIPEAVRLRLWSDLTGKALPESAIREPFDWAFEQLRESRKPMEPDAKAEYMKGLDAKFGAAFSQRRGK